MDHSDYLALLRRLRALPGVKKVFIRSGIRFDYLIADPDDSFFKELVEHHVSGQLKVAPEHISDRVLQYLGKPRKEVYEKFVRKYNRLNEQLGKLAEYLRDLGYMPEQVQDFYPTPSTVSTVMYYTGIDPRDGKKVYVCRNPHEKAMQRALIQYRNPNNYELVMEALIKGGREDLIGFDKKCLIRPRKTGNVRGTEADDRNAGGRGRGRENMRQTGVGGGRAGEIRKSRQEKSRTKIGSHRTDSEVRKKKTIRNVHKKKK